MGKLSAGLVMYRLRDQILEVFLVHPGGPFWMKKDLGAWSIPKGEYLPEEDSLCAARREFTEETGLQPNGYFIPLSPVTQAGGKLVQAWAFAGDADPTTIISNSFSMEWPPRSGQQLHLGAGEVNRRRQQGEVADLHENLSRRRAVHEHVARWRFDALEFGENPSSEMLAVG